MKKNIKKEFIEHHNTCPLCKGPTNACRMHQGNRECIACKDKNGFGYSFKPREATKENIQNYVKIQKEMIPYQVEARKELIQFLFKKGLIK